MLVRFGNLAIEWSLVYAVVNKNPCEVYFDLAEHTPRKKASVEARPLEISGTLAWKMACKDARFTVFKKSIAIEMSKVAIVFDLAGESKVLFRLPSGDLETLLVHSNIAAAILQHIGKANHGSSGKRPKK